MTGNADASLGLAAGFEQAGKQADAESTYRKVIGEHPQNAVARFNFACFLRRRGRLDEALEEHQAALDLQIERPEEVLSNMAVIQAELRRDAAAKLLLERALAANPTYVPAMFNLALHHEEYGDRALALTLFRRILEIDPFRHDALVRIAHAETVRDPDGEVVRRLRRALRRSNIDALTRESLHFALGKALDDCGRYDEAFEQYAIGNRVSEGRLPRYDPAAVADGVSKVIEAFTEERIRSATPVSEAPLIFITGMYRSGSTLFEQVLAAHPCVTAGGEIDYFMRFPLSLDPADWQAIGRGYVDYLSRSFPGAQIVTNKRPDAFALLGMLKAVFPNARFVNTVRDPRDTCLSIWFQQFDGRLGYAADLTKIAHHHRQYRRLMAHWRGLFGESIFDADYDEYVRDPRARDGKAARVPRTRVARGLPRFPAQSHAGTHRERDAGQGAALPEVIGPLAQLRAAARRPAHRARGRLARRPHPEQVLAHDVEPHAALGIHAQALDCSDFVQLVDLHPLVLVGDVALDEGDRDEPLARAHGHDLVQQRRRIDDRLARRALERQRLVPHDHRELAALVGRGIADEDCAGQVRADLHVGQLDDRRVGVRAVLHARLVATQERRRDALGQREARKLARAGHRVADDLHRFRVLGVGRVGLQVLLARVRGIRDAAIDELELARERDEARAFLGREQVLDLEQHGKRTISERPGPCPGRRR